MKVRQKQILIKFFINFNISMTNEGRQKQISIKFLKNRFFLINFSTSMMFISNQFQLCACLGFHFNKTQLQTFH